jgi:hypothetical protein
MSPTSQELLLAHRWPAAVVVSSLVLAATVISVNETVNVNGKVNVGGKLTVEGNVGAKVKPTLLPLLLP